MRKNQQCKELEGRAFRAVRTGGSKVLMGKSLGYSRNTKGDWLCWSEGSGEVGPRICWDWVGHGRP